MVEDSKIEAKKSPFALREGEIKTFDGKDRICVNEPNCSKNKLRTYKRFALCDTWFGKWIWVYNIKATMSNARL